MGIGEKTEGLGENGGFTLLELLVALTILSVGLLGTAMLTTGIIRGNFFSKNITYCFHGGSFFFTIRVRNEQLASE
jgi:prepilin-type N-terminal cleavage/methylation domain-containing protein